MSDSIEMQRPPEAVPITKNGALHKLVLHEGTGELPPKHARCLGEVNLPRPGVQLAASGCWRVRCVQGVTAGVRAASTTRLPLY